MYSWTSTAGFTNTPCTVVGSAAPPRAGRPRCVRRCYDTSTSVLRDMPSAAGEVFWQNAVGVRVFGWEPGGGGAAYEARY